MSSKVNFHLVSLLTNVALTNTTNLYAFHRRWSVCVKQETVCRERKAGDRKERVTV